MTTALCGFRLSLTCRSCKSSIDNNHQHDPYFHLDINDVLSSITIEGYCSECVDNCEICQDLFATSEMKYCNNCSDSIYCVKCFNDNKNGEIEFHYCENDLCENGLCENQICCGKCIDDFNKKNPNNYHCKKCITKKYKDEWPFLD